MTSQLASSFNNGWVLIGVAAMSYAACVESIASLDVITSSTEITEDWIKKQSKVLFDKLTEKGY